MFSLKINIVGCDERILPPAARKVLQTWGTVDVDIPNIAAIRNGVVMVESEARLFVVRVASEDDVQELKRLNGSHPGSTILAVVDSSNDPGLLVKTMRAGALQVIAQPVEPKDLQEALDCIAMQHRGLSTLARTVAVTGAVGGCGGTMVAINLSYEMARLRTVHCILMELALRKGVLANHLDISPRYTTADLVADIQRVDNFVLQGALTEIAENLFALAGPYHTIEATPVDIDNVMKLINLTRHLAAWLILDIPCTYDDLFFRALTTADHVVLVAEQTVAAIRGAQMVCEVLGQRQPLVVINQYNPKIQGFNLERIQGFLPTCEICSVATDMAVIDSMNSGQPLRSHSPRSQVLADIENLAKQIVPEGLDDKPSQRESSVLGRFTRSISHS